VGATLYFAIPGNINNLTGGYAYDRQLIAELRRLGWDVVLLPLSARFPFPDAEALRDAETCFAALADDSLVLVDGLAFCALDQLAIRHARRLRLIALCHHPLALETGLSPAQAQQLRQSEAQALHCARAVIVTSSLTAQILIQEFAVQESHITAAPPGTAPGLFAACRGEPPILLTVATLTPRKAHDQLITALAGLTHLPWNVRFVGGEHFAPAWAAQLHQQVIRAGLTDRIHFVGSVTHLAAEYQQADVFVLPSLFEGYGMVYAEALAHGLPVVASRTGAASELVPAEAGLLVPPGDISALTQALGAILSQHDLRRHLQLGAQQVAATLPRWSNTAAIVANLLATIR
jgi:glycosyltransferase involved in cell wall biosynthesis